MRADLLDVTKPLVWTVDDVLSKKECDDLVARIEKAGPTVAPITTHLGAVLDTNVRNNTRVMFEDAELAGVLFQRVRDHVPKELSGLQLASANERLRCYRYTEGQRFAPHYDGAFVRNKSERSLLTFMIYLNEGFGGGRTSFLDLERVVEPKTGRALLFQHFLLHEGAPVTSGVKYALRTDVMYRASP